MYNKEFIPAEHETEYKFTITATAYVNIVGTEEDARELLEDDPRDYIEDIEIWSDSKC